MADPTPSPAPPRNEDELLDALTTPGPRLVEFIRTLPGPLVILGAGGKMGPTLAVLARRAAEAAGHSLDIVAVSRFSDVGARHWLETRGIRTIAADLLDRETLHTLPDARNVVLMTGLKFGTRDNPSLTWATNTLVPAHVAERYPDARIVALSTGNVYPLVPVRDGGATEDQPLTPPGEYANAAVARERILDFFSRRNGTPIALLRLNYAVELRYGVLVDIARRIRGGEPVDVRNGWLNCIWQGDANDMILRSLPLAASPAAPWNLTRPGPLSVRTLAEELARRLDIPVRFSGVESDTALLNNPARLCTRLGEPPTPLETVLDWTADWIRNNRPLLGKPTHFETRDGAF